MYHHKKIWTPRLRKLARASLAVFSDYTESHPLLRIILSVSIFGLSATSNNGGGLRCDAGYRVRRNYYAHGFIDK
jgi:hypothetical protein